MKSERRHELSRNALEAELFRIWEFLRRRGSLLAWSALGVAAVVLGVVWYMGKGRAEAEKVQAEFSRLVLGKPPDERQAGLEAIAVKTSLPRWAALANVVLGDDCAQQLMEQWYALSDADRSDLRSQAEGYYQKVISEFPKEESAVARARYGLGVLAEDWGDVEAARAYYEEVLQAAQTSQSLRGDPVFHVARRALIQLGQFQGAVYMPATAPSTVPSTVPATEPATGPATSPTTGPATSSGPATRPVTREILPASGPASPAAIMPASAPSTRRAAPGPTTAQSPGGTTAESD